MYILLFFSTVKLATIRDFVVDDMREPNQDTKLASFLNISRSRSRLEILYIIPFDLHILNRNFLFRNCCFYSLNVTAIVEFKLS